MRDRTSTILAALSATGLLAGCSFLGASYAVTDAALATRTESAPCDALRRAARQC